MPLSFAASKTCKGTSTVEDAGGGCFPGEIAERQRGNHKNDRHAGGQSRKKISRSTAAEDRGARSPENGSHVGPFAGLQQHDGDETETNDDMNNGNENNHGLLKRNKNTDDPEKILRL